MASTEQTCLHTERICEGCLCSESEIEDLHARIKELEERLESVQDNQLTKAERRFSLLCRIAEYKVFPEKVEAVKGQLGELPPKDKRIAQRWLANAQRPTAHY